ncbi:SETD3/SETD6 methyltransferase [Abortiporus biennis]
MTSNISNNDNNRLSTLLSWCSENNIRIDPNIHLVQDEINGRISVWSKDTPIESYPVTLVTIPKSAVLSVRSCVLAGQIPIAHYGHKAHLALSLALYSEILLGPDSRFFGYIQSLPLRGVEIALFWGSDDYYDNNDKDQDLGDQHHTHHSQRIQDQDQRTQAHHEECTRDHHRHKDHNERENKDRKLAYLWSKGTEIEKELWVDEDGRKKNLLEEIRTYYFCIAEPLLRLSNLSGPFSSRRRPGRPLERREEKKSDEERQGGDELGQERRGEAEEGDELGEERYSLKGFMKAYSLVSSRAFLVDAYHGLAMVPIADAFNHVQDNHVHLESDFDVCVTCGSVGRCEHDEDDDMLLDSSSSDEIHDGPPVLSNEEEEDGEENTCEMVSNVPIPPHSEIFNTYGDKLTNAQLLVRYGFMLDGNENDVVRFEVDELPLPLSNGEEERRKFRMFYEEMIRSWSWDAQWTESELVYNPSSSMVLAINADAKVTHHLWVWCALVAIGRNGKWEDDLSAEGALGLMTELAEKVIYLEREIAGGRTENNGSGSEDNDDYGKAEAMEEDGADGEDGTGPGNSRTVLADLVRTLAGLCRARSKQLGSCAEEALDQLESGMAQTRLAMMEVVGERSLLESCLSVWEELTAA